MANTKSKKVPKEAKLENHSGADTVIDAQETIEAEVAAKTVKTPRKKPTTTSSKKPVVTRLISATSKVSTELEGVWYSFSYSESREVNDDSNIEDARLDLWNTVHSEVDNQVSYTIDSLKGSVPASAQATPVNNNYNIPPEYDY